MALIDRIAKVSSRQELTVIPGSTQAMPKAAPFSEIGVSGLLRTSGVGYVFEEFLAELSSYKQKQVYREMRDNDAVIGAMFFALEMILRRSEWRVEPAKGKKGDQYGEFVKSCMQDMSMTWEDFVAECVSEFAFGFALFETVYKRRQGQDGKKASRFDDGLIGWRKFAPRAQESILYWIWDDEGGLQGAVQLAAPDYRTVPIPIEKLLLFRTTSNKNNPEGRAATLDTPIPTPTGWTSFGEVKVGDQVYDENGEFTEVVAKSEVWKDRSLFEVQFSKGTAIKADANHLWSVTTHNRGEGRSPRILTTQQLHDEIQTGKPRHFSCGQAPILQGEENDLPVDPYYLGYWLGNGTRGNSELRCDVKDAREICNQIRTAGYKAFIPDLDWDPADSTRTIRVQSRKRKWDKDCPQSKLRRLGVRNNKHIPVEYLRASVEQRLSLLQGLMDSDGSVSLNGDEIAFCNTNLSLIQGVAELVRSLGGVPHVRLAQRAGRIGGRGIIGRQDVYCVAFRLDLPAFRLRRKLKKQKLEKTSRNSGHFIKAVVPLESEDTVCIEVASPSHLFLAGEGMVPTHNSLLRNCYRSWSFKRRIEEVEGIGIERDLCGLPVIYASGEVIDSIPGGLGALKKMVTNIRMDNQAGVVLPMAYDDKGNPLVKLELLRSGGSKVADVNAAISRYNADMLNTILSGFIQFGESPHGSKALHMSATAIFSLAISAFMDSIAAIVNRIAIPRLMVLNRMDLEYAPKLVPGEIGVRDLNELSEYISKLAASGLTFFDRETSGYLRKIARLPDEPEEPETPPPGAAVSGTPLVPVPGTPAAQMPPKPEQSVTAKPAPPRSEEKPAVPVKPKGATPASGKTDAESKLQGVA